MKVPERVLMGHRITQEEPEPWGVEVSTALSRKEFERRFLEERNFTRQQGVGLRLTLDDGYDDGAEFAADLAAEGGCELVIFLCSGFVDQTNASFEWALSAVVKTLRDRAGTVVFSLSGQDDGQVRSAAEWYERFRVPLRKADSMRRAEWLKTFCSEVGVDVESDRKPTWLTWDKVRSLAGQEHVNFGAHTVTHPYLPALSTKDVWRELRLSGSRIAAELGTRPRSVAYPYGGRSVRVDLLARMAGFYRGFTTKPALRLSARGMKIGRFDLNQPLVQKIVRW